MGGNTVTKESPYQQALAQIAGEETARYKAETVPLLKRGQELAQSAGSPAMIERAGNASSGAVLADSSPQIQGGLRSLGVRGVQAGSGAGAMTNATARSSIGKGLSQAGFGGRFGQRTAQIAGMGDNLALAMGEQASGQMGLAQVAGQQQQLAESKIENEIKGSSALGQGVGTAVGLGLAYR